MSSNKCHTCGLLSSALTSASQSAERTPQDMTIKACGRCKCVFYCGVECQSTNWSEHKSLCSKIVKARTNQSILSQMDELGWDTSSSASLINIALEQASSSPSMIDFKSVYPDASPGAYGSLDDPSPCFHLDTPEKSVSELLNAEETVISDRSSVWVIISYPLSRPVLVEVMADTTTGFTRGGLALAIGKHYQRIYQEESETTVRPAGNIPGMLNRVRTNGRYGIWGHGLSDLDLITILYENGFCKLSVDS